MKVHLNSGCLFKRGIGDSNLCPFCSRVPESVDHALWGCKASSSSWKECPFFSELNSLRWSPPSAGFKFNVDAAVDAVSGRFGVGI
ncbi:hypothetical protein ACOSP7_019433 [Xanthoceras sorbifolium]